MQITTQHNIQAYKNDYWTLVDEDKDLHKDYVYVYVLGITENKNTVDGLKSWDSNMPSHLQSSCHDSKNIFLLLVICLDL